MICSKCNAQISDEAVYCPYCGTKIKVEADIQRETVDHGGYGDYNEGPMVDMQPQRPMKWFNFLIYFSLFAGAVMSLFTAVIYFTGTIYVSGEGTFVADAVYSVFPMLKFVDLGYAAYSICLAVFMVFTRFRLSHFKKGAPLLVVIVYALQALSYVVYVGMVVLAVEGSGLLNASDIVDVSSVGSTVVTSTVMAIINHVYFKKRADLFVN